MRCPFCLAADTRVIDSRLAGEGDQVRRRRECPKCEERFTTFESAELIMPRVIKRNGIRQQFDQTKVRMGILRSLEKRSIDTEIIESAIARIEHRLRTSGEREIRSRILGEWVMEELRKIDQVAYIRFASIYRSFKDINDFLEEIKRLKNELSSS